MKKRFVWMLVLLVSFFTFVSCGTSDTPITPQNHIHEFGAEWQNDNVNHWHICECGEKDAAAHTFGEWIVDSEATCTESGEWHHVCSVCGKSVSEEIPAKGHTIVTEKGTAATCTENGLTDKTFCSVCQTVLTEQTEIPSTGHIVVTDKAMAATCTVDGLTEGSHCSACNAVLKAQEKVKAPGHNFVDGVCTRCGIDKYSEGLVYTRSEDGMSWIVSDVGTCKDTDIVIPAVYEDLAVTAIGDCAFFANRSLTSIHIPDTVTNIRGGAFFECSSLTNITIPDGVKSIGEQAFGFCISLTSIHIPDSVTSIGEDAFRDCVSLTSITVSDSVTTIGTGAFCGCTGLTNITIPNSVTTIGPGVFYGCTSLTNITIPNRVTRIEDNTFWLCTSLKSIIIPDSVTSIGYSALSGCGSLASIIYQGTVAQWKAITKGSDWNHATGNYSVICTDGTLTKEEA